jgi:hypothetical protein
MTERFRSQIKPIFPGGVMDSFSMVTCSKRRPPSAFEGSTGINAESLQMAAAAILVNLNFDI